MILEERTVIMNNNPPIINNVNDMYIYFNWDWVGCGFGQLDVQITEDKLIVIQNELMKREAVRKLLHTLADYIADRAVLYDYPEDIPPIDLMAEREQIKQQCMSKQA